MKYHCIREQHFASHNDQRVKPFCGIDKPVSPICPYELRSYKSKIHQITLIHISVEFHLSIVEESVSVASSFCLIFEIPNRKGAPHPQS